jgi:acyl-[acyl-carrier-protein] desaturase
MANWASDTKFLSELETTMDRVIANHTEGRKPWSPNRLLFPEQSAHAEERIDAIKRLTLNADNIQPAIRAMLVLNALTEGGLPHFHRLIALHLGYAGPWLQWDNLWTAEENQHLAVLCTYLQLTNIVDLSVYDDLWFEYLHGGFNPDWSADPVCMIVAYTVLQEKATQISHRNIIKHVKTSEPILAGILGHVAADEGRHALAYRTVFQKMLELEPDRAIRALYGVIQSFTMPGVGSACFGTLEDIADRTGVFTQSDFVSIVRELVTTWKLDQLAVASNDARSVLAKIVRFAEPKLETALKKRAQGRKPRTFELPFIRGAFQA